LLLYQFIVVFGLFLTEFWWKVKLQIGFIWLFLSQWFWWVYKLFLFFWKELLVLGLIFGLINPVFTKKKTFLVVA